MLLRKVLKSPALARVLPFLVFLGLTFAQEQFGQAARYWFYLGKTLVGLWLVFEMWDFVPEIGWNLNWQAVCVGFGVFAVWVGLDHLYPHTQDILQRLAGSWAPKAKWAGNVASASPWNPFAQFGSTSALAWAFVAVRLLGSTLVVPPLEEVFYRSFLYRWIARPDFSAFPLGRFAWRPFVLSALFFGLAHNEWLAAIFCAMAYQALVLRNKRLGDAMTAHAVTNFLLGAWVVWGRQWHFW